MALLFLLLIGGRSALASVHQELGDAGDRYAPQATIGDELSPLTEIHGDIGGGDEVDAFLFRVIGGAGLFGVKVSFDEPGGDSLFAGIFAVISEDPYVLGDKQLGVPDEIQGDITNYSLAEGLYVLEVTTSMISDPPFTVNLIDVSPESGGQIFASSNAVPEPGTISLCAIGVCGLAFMRRRRFA